MKVPKALTAALITATLNGVRARHRERDIPRQDLQYEAHYFQQRINHFPDNKLPFVNETFTQRYYFDSSYYKPGGPVYLYISGETSATNGVGVILENRYYGASYPFNTSTTDQLAFLNTAQTIADNSHFAQNAVFPGIGGDLKAPGTPWILYGGSLAGAQTHSQSRNTEIFYTEKYAPQVSSSTICVLESQFNSSAARDCVSRINNIIDKFDTLVAKNRTVAIKRLKALFGLEDLTDHRDFASAIADPIGNPGNYFSNTWQELNWNSSYGSHDFFYFCGNVSNIDAPKEISEIDYSLSNYTNGEPWVGLGGYAGTQNQSAWADITNSASRSYLYTSCTEQGAYIDAPKEGPSLISRVIDTSYEQQWCTWAFPKGAHNQVPSSPNLDVYNSFGDFNFTADRLAFIDGDQDVWNGLCYHSPLALTRRQTSDLHPELLVTGAGHHWDSYGILDVESEPQFIREAHLWEIRTVKKWLREFDSWKSRKISNGERIKP
ncbi:hypothetical protein EKO27_g6366 [Xylaria grammica]|uniref:Extracelular serine carboxypeptidase n=1 Tax=Xylaria grammica TaxID=363999 RepID=A0A439D2Q5_9PEZI|nr:hypothetical protein EKO27_g6366 [Xylaria grammica]